MPTGSVSAATPSSARTTGIRSSSQLTQRRRCVPAFHHYLRRSGAGLRVSHGSTQLMSRLPSTQRRTRWTQRPADPYQSPTRHCAVSAAPLTVTEADQLAMSMTALPSGSEQTTPKPQRGPESAAHDAYCRAVLRGDDVDVRSTRSSGARQRLLTESPSTRSVGEAVQPAVGDVGCLSAGV